MAKRITAFLWLLAVLPAGFADEGMWLFNQFPAQAVKQKYGFTVTDGFLDSLRLASVKMGASGSFVSPRGLIFTNHHVGLSCVQKVSSPERNYVGNGFLAASESEELRCPGLEVSVLEGIEDVTGRVEAALTAPSGSAEANRQRQRAVAAIERECGARCDVVTLYAGARYRLYRYKRYTDVRLVFTPEFEVGFFGGDPDNFTYPRYNLDITFFRAYENGRPASTPHYLRWSREGAREGELVFVSGHPGGSSRLATLAELQFRRDRLYPAMLARLESRIAALEAYGSHSAEHARVARTVRFGAENSRKRLTGFLQGLRDAKLMEAKADQERRVRAAVNEDARLRQQYGAAWDEAAAALKTYAALHQRYALLETGAITGSDLFSYARTLVRLAAEKPRANGDRLREYTDAALPALERRLYSEAPATASFEEAVVAEYLSALAGALGAGDAVVRAALAGRSPAAAAKAYVSSSRLAGVAERKRLAANAGALAGSHDGMIELARLLDEPARAARKRYEDEVEAKLNAAKAKVARARFALYGAAEYPDSTGTLRLSYAVIRGYRNARGEAVPWATDFAGLFRRAIGSDPYRLPQRWLAAKDRLRSGTPLNFAATADTHGGNSGSPTVNTKGEIVGILFDSNLEKLPNEFLYTEEAARSVHVASQGILEALGTVYGAGKLVDEMLGR